MPRSYGPLTLADLYTLSLHDALPIFHRASRKHVPAREVPRCHGGGLPAHRILPVDPVRHREDPMRRKTSTVASRNLDRKSTRLNSSHVKISYAVFCLKKKKK